MRAVARRTALRSTGARKRGRWDADGDAFPRRPSASRCAFVSERDEVAVKEAREPHRVAVEIGRDDREMRFELLLFDEVRDDARGHEVRADGDVRIEFADELDELRGVEPVELRARGSFFHGSSLAR